MSIMSNAPSMVNNDKCLDVLGTSYQVCYRDYHALSIFEKQSIGGYCDSISKKIVVCNMKTYPGYEEETEEYCQMSEKQTLRHEIIHAFFNESGLQESSLQYSAGWARNEEMVDWIALQFPKLLKAMETAGAL